MTAFVTTVGACGWLLVAITVAVVIGLVLDAALSRTSGPDYLAPWVDRAPGDLPVRGEDERP